MYIYIYTYIYIYIYIYLYIYIYIYIMRPSGYHHNDFVANHALGHDKAIMLITGEGHCIHD